MNNIDYETGEFTGTSIHPVTGDKVKIIDCGTLDTNVNAFDSSPGYPSFEYEETGEILTHDELESVIELDGIEYHLHEWLYDGVKWD